MRREQTGWTDDDLRQDLDGRNSGGRGIKSLEELGEEDRKAKRAWRRERDSTPDVVEQMRWRR